MDVRGRRTDAPRANFGLDALTIIDLCTGSGSIAISTALGIKNCHVYATDISDKALVIAKENAGRLSAAGKITFLPGDLSQSQRQEALNGFRNGKYRILVATDIAARGLDISRISHVINYDMPDTVDAYTHRIGRTGRAHLTGEAFTFVGPDDEPIVRAIERVLGKRIERRRLPGFDYGGFSLEAPTQPRPASRPAQPRSPVRRPLVETTRRPNRCALG